MNKKIIFLLCSTISLNIYACPRLIGRYNKCKSEVNPKMRGEYLIEQHQENNYEVYKVQFIDDETGEEKTDTIPTNGSVISRKERVPKVGVNVRVEARSKCDTNNVITDSKIFFLGSHVGQFTTKIYRTGNTLHSDIDGSYLSKDIHKRITCELE